MNCLIVVVFFSWGVTWYAQVYFLWIKYCLYSRSVCTVVCIIYSDETFLRLNDENSYFIHIHRYFSKLLGVSVSLGVSFCTTSRCDVIDFLCWFAFRNAHMTCTFLFIHRSCIEKIHTLVFFEPIQYKISHKLFVYNSGYTDYVFKMQVLLHFFLNLRFF